MSTQIHHQASVQATADETALRISRMQPLHLGHIDAIKQAFEKDFIKKLFIGIGSANKKETADNPFSAGDRKQMLLDVLSDEGILEKCSIYYLMDFGDNTMRRAQIDNELEAFKYIISDNDVLPAIFHDKIFMQSEVRIDTRGTIIRNALFEQDIPLLKKFLHPTTFETLERIDAYNKIAKIFGPENRKPRRAADIVIKDENNRTLFIERKNNPLGIALPGGMIDPGETGLEAGLREGCEEIGGNNLDAEIIIDGKTATRGNLKIQITRALGYKDDPKRDPRGPVISFPFEVKIISGEPKAADDAKDVLRLSQEEIINLPSERWAFKDHKDIALETYPNPGEDIYLNEENCINRLIDDYRKHGSLVIAYDYDNTVYDFHKKGYSFENVISLLQEAKAVLGNSYFSVFTANDDHAGIREYLQKYNIPMNGINTSPSFWKGESTKPYYNILLDDRAGLPSAYRQLKAVVEYAKEIK